MAGWLVVLAVVVTGAAVVATTTTRATRALGAARHDVDDFVARARRSES